MDSIIQSVNNCPTYKDTKIEFVFFSQIRADQTNVSIENINIHNFDYTNCDGMFYYKGYKFNLEGTIIDSLFELTNQSIQFPVVDPYKLMIDIDDSGLRWSFLYESNKFKCISYKNCYTSWFDESHFVPEL